MYRPDYDSARRQSPSARYLNVLLIGIVVGVLAFVVNADWGVPGFLTTAREETPEAEVDENYQGVVSPRGNDGATLVPVATATSVVVTVVTAAEPVARVPDFALPDLLDETVVRRVSDYAGRPFTTPQHQLMIVLTQLTKQHTLFAPRPTRQIACIASGKSRISSLAPFVNQFMAPRLNLVIG